MIRFITKDDPSFWETLETHRRHQEYHRRKNDPIWKDGPMTAADYITIVKQTPSKAANIISNWKNKISEIDGNPVIPEVGQLHLIGEATQEALNEIQKLNEQQAVAADLALKALRAERDKKRPKVGADEYRRLADQFRHLDSKGINVDQMISRFGNDPQALAVLQQEADSLAWGQAPMDPGAGEGPQAQIEQKALGVFGDDYVQADDKIRDFEKGAYRSQVALSAALRQIRNDDRGEFAAPAFDEGQLIEA